MARGRKAKRTDDQPVRVPPFDERGFLRLEQRASLLLAVALGFAAALAVAGAALTAQTGGDLRLGSALGVLGVVVVIPLAQALGLSLTAVPAASTEGGRAKGVAHALRSGAPPQTPVHLPALKLVGVLVSYLLVFTAVLVLLVNPPLADYAAPLVIPHTLAELPAGSPAEVRVQVVDNGAVEEVSLTVTGPSGTVAGPLPPQPLDSSMYLYVLPPTVPAGSYSITVVATDTRGLVGELSFPLSLVEPQPLTVEVDAVLHQVTVSGAPLPILVTYAYDVPANATAWWTDPAVRERVLHMSGHVGTLSVRGLVEGSHTVHLCAWPPGAAPPTCFDGRPIAV